MSDVWFWGCWRRIGHYLWSPRGESFRYQYARLPWPQIDGTLTPGLRNRYGDVEARDQVEGLTCVHHADDWTCVAWWDRSVDSRYGSNAAIFVPGTLSLEQSIAVGVNRFPSVFGRFEYTIREQ